MSLLATIREAMKVSFTAIHGSFGAKLEDQIDDTAERVAGAVVALVPSVDQIESLRCELEQAIAAKGRALESLSVACKRLAIAERYRFSEDWMARLETAHRERDEAREKLEPLERNGAVAELERRRHEANDAARIIREREHTIAMLERDLKFAREYLEKQREASQNAVRELDAEIARLRHVVEQHESARTMIDGLRKAVENAQAAFAEFFEKTRGKPWRE
jgi:chromosome segregation ATPase